MIETILMIYWGIGMVFATLTTQFTPPPAEDMSLQYQILEFLIFMIFWPFAVTWLFFGNFDE